MEVWTVIVDGSTHGYYHAYWQAKAVHCFLWLALPFSEVTLEKLS
jgi:hypothetical protein